MEEEVKSIQDYLSIVWRRKYWIVIPAILLMVIVTLVVFSLPATYKSEGLILIESQEIPPDLVRTTVTSYADQRIEVIKQRLVTTTRVMEFVNKHNLYVEERQKTPVTGPIVELFRENLDVSLVQANVTDPVSGRAQRANIAFTVSFYDKSPQKAQQVANDLVTEFLSENVRTRTDRAQDTASFLRLEGDRMQRAVQQTEKEIAEFRDEYSDSLPDLLDYNLTMVQNIQQEISGTENQIMVLSDQVTTMSMQLSMIPRTTATTINPANPNQPSSAQMRLENLRAELSSMQSRYSANHPDLLRTQREISALETELGVTSTSRQLVASQLETAKTQLQNLQQRYSTEHPDLRAAQAEVVRLEQRLEALPIEQTSDNAVDQAETGSNNPVYIEVRSKISATEREIERMRIRQADLRQKLAEFEARVFKTNQVQRAYQDLTRDHENKLRQYRELRAKQLNAELSQTLEAENKGESFTLIEPPQIPSSAEKPNRKKLLAMGFIASVGSGLGLGLLIELIFGGVRGYKQVTRVVGSPPLVVIPNIVTASQSRRKKSLIVLLVLGLIAAMAAALVGIHLFVTNLEVFWFKLINKINLL